MWLELNKPTAASAITSLTWVADGIDDTELQVIQDLVYIEISYKKGSTQALANRSWVRDGVSELEAHVILRLRDLLNYAESDGEKLLSLPFLDSIEPVDAAAVDVLARLASGSSDLFRVVLEKPWMENGFAESEVSVIQGLQKLSESSEEAALLILSLPFLQAVEDADAGAVDVLASLEAGHPELFRVVLQKPWVKDGLSEKEIEALWAFKGLQSEATGLLILESVSVGDAATLIALVGLAESDSQLFSAVVYRPWLDDGLDNSETVVLGKLEEISRRNEAANLWISTHTPSQGLDSAIGDSIVERYDRNSSGAIEHAEVLLAVTDSSNEALNEDEFLHVIALYGFSEALIQTPPLMELVMATSWYQDGITSDLYHTEPSALRALQKIDNNDTELAQTVLEWSWVFDEQLDIEEASVLEYLAEIDELAPELTPIIVNLPWLADNIDGWESTTTSRLYELIMWNAPDFAVELATAPWVADGVTPLEVLYGINSLKDIAISPDSGSTNTQVARQIMDLIRYPPNVLDLSLVNVMGNLREHTAFNVQTGMDEHLPDSFNSLVSEPWFVDGLNQRERVYLIATLGSDRDRLLDPHTIETMAIELPLAGPVNLWVVGHYQFDSRNILAAMEQAVRGSEEFWDIPFPIEHIILYVLEPGTRGVHIGFMMFLDSVDGGIPQSTMFHEVAHYYFHSGPRWFIEGGANAVAIYVSNSGNFTSPVFPDYCAEQGLKNLQDWTELGGGWLWDSCSYSMGEHFLLTLREVMGEEAWLSALRELYLQYGTNYTAFYSSSDPPTAATDEDIYRVFMEHAPLDSMEKVNDVFRRLHGGPFID